MDDRRLGRSGGSDRTDSSSMAPETFRPDSYGGRNLHFGVREHGMAAALNGMAVSKMRPFGGTFFNFSDYMRPVGPSGGADGDAVHLMCSRTIPLASAKTGRRTNPSSSWLPCAPCLASWCSVRATPMKWSKPGKSSCSCSIEPAALVLSRQAVPTFDRTKYGCRGGSGKGAYILADAAGRQAGSHPDWQLAARFLFASMPTNN